MPTQANVAWAGEGFAPDGTKTIGFQSGTWEKTGNHEWKLKMTGKDSREGAIYKEQYCTRNTNMVRRSL